MNTFVSGESDASGQGPHIAVGPAAVAIRRPELGNAWNVVWRGMAGRGRAWLGMEYGKARRGEAGPFWAWRGREYGMARRGRARLGSARLGWARQGLASRGKEYGVAVLGKARRGMSAARNKARPGVARLCGAWHGKELGLA